MRISAEQKRQNRSSILKAAVDLAENRGFEKVTMSQVTNAAGMSEATIYRYFPNKQALILGYYHDSFIRAFKQAVSPSDFAEYTFVEKIQGLLEAHFALLSEDISFVSETFGQVFANPLNAFHPELKTAQSLHEEFVNESLNTALEQGEFSEPPLSGFFSRLFWDFHIGILFYFVHDDSKDKENTSQFLEKTLGLIESILQVGALSRLYDLGYFLIKEHVLGFAGKAPKIKTLKGLHNTSFSEKIRQWEE